MFSKNFSLKRFLFLFSFFTVFLFVMYNIVWESAKIVDGRVKRKDCSVHQTELHQEKVEVIKLRYNDFTQYQLQIRQIYFPYAFSCYYNSYPSRVSGHPSNYISKKAIIKYCADCRKTEHFFNEFLKKENINIMVIIGLIFLRNSLLKYKEKLSGLFNKEELPEAKIFLTLFAYGLTNVDQKYRLDTLGIIEGFAIKGLTEEKMKEIRKKITDAPYAQKELITLVVDLIKDLEKTF